MPANYVLLERIELNASAASVTFSNIPQSGYTDLKLVGSVRSDYSGQGIALRINPNGSTTNMTGKVLLGSGSAASSFSDTIAYASAVADTSTANTYNNVEWYIPNYTSSNNKSISVDFVTETNASAAIMGLSAGLWSSSSAITSLVIATTAGNLMTGSTFSLYGLAAVGTTPAIAPKASGGNITTDGTYWYHTFLSSGTFTPATALTCDALVVAGGGGGASRGNRGGGGGGAGGLLGFSAQTLSLSTSYTITVGAGGSWNSGGLAANGSNSKFGALTTAIGGGGGTGGGNNGTPGNGGSGGGAFINENTSAGGIGGTGTSGQGYAGGNSSVFSTASGPNYYFGGAGGGAGAVGAAGVYNSSTGPNGGVGATYNTSVGGTAGPYAFIDAMGAATSTGQLVSGHYYYAGGGGGGSGQYGGSSAPSSNGGYGGGGAGSGANTSGTNGIAGTTNTGGGGGGSNYDTAGNGGSGIVIIRYSMS